MSRGIRRIAAIAALGLLAAACAAPERWQNPGVPEARWRQDADACRDQAAVQARREGVRDILYHGDITMSRGDALGRRMAAFVADKRRRTLLARCLQSKGYKRAE